ncbi:glycerophosphodiester phosphodiesterase family protein [Sphingomonas xanthus]|uniref:Glycerophosphodiester phosphodiesterase n=1 Tax=Sphingomonas xanthus TaxID=2594473 RepID=A0A516IRT8_9SPHN|nr:glycerophosphodiester phosphodiesterase family protein [Sphingomonas xanthus]QDP19626.1 glycerophosphodiester phosphodiesterase [Sphingomonas xanthus]
MRSSPSRTDPLDPGPAGFAHRGLFGSGVPENSMAAFEAALAIGAGIECDVRLAEDGKLVVFHDHDLRRLCASALAIETSPAAIITAQRLLDSDQRIPLLADLLDLMGGRAPVLIEVKTRGANVRRIAEAVGAAVAAYRGVAGVMSFNPDIARAIGRYRPAIRRGLVLSRKASAFDRWRCLRRARPQFLAVDCGAIRQGWVARNRSFMPVYSWTVRTADELEMVRVHADAPIWEGDGRPRN